MTSRLPCTVGTEAPCRRTGRRWSLTNMLASPRSAITVTREQEDDGKRTMRKRGCRLSRQVCRHLPPGDRPDGTMARSPERQRLSTPARSRSEQTNSAGLGRLDGNYTLGLDVFRNRRCVGHPIWQRYGDRRILGGRRIFCRARAIGKRTSPEEDEDDHGSPRGWCRMFREHDPGRRFAVASKG